MTGDDQRGGMTPALKRLKRGIYEKQKQSSGADKAYQEKPVKPSGYA